MDQDQNRIFITLLWGTNMEIFFSKSTNGFYNKELNGDNIPKDAVTIDEATYFALFENQSKGQIIIGDENGYPINAPAPGLSEEEKAAIQAKQEAKKSAITKLTALGLTQSEIDALIG